MLWRGLFPAVFALGRVAGSRAAIPVVLALAACGGDGGGSGPEPEPVASVTVAPGDFTLPVGESEQLTATVEDEAGNPLTDRDVTWASSDDGVATVSPTGLVSAVGPGAATVSATSEGKSGSAALSVFVPVATVAISPEELTLVVGAPRPLKATARDASGLALAGRPITWGTSNPLIATVSANGVVTGVAPGAVTITATSEGKEGSAAITVGPPVTFTSVAAGGAHTCALTTDGAAYCWGRGESGQLGVPIPTGSCITDGGPYPAAWSSSPWGAAMSLPSSPRAAPIRVASRPTERRGAGVATAAGRSVTIPPRPAMRPSPWPPA